jgi:hypothetical protein
VNNTNAIELICVRFVKIYQRVQNVGLCVSVQLNPQIKFLLKSNKVRENFIEVPNMKCNPIHPRQLKRYVYKV